MADRLLESAAAMNRVAAVLERSIANFDRARQELFDFAESHELFRHEMSHEIRGIGERLALLDRGVQEVDRGVDRVKEVTGVHELLKPEKEDGAFLTFGGWRIPLAGLFWKAARFIGPAIGGTGFGALVHHLLSKH
jgi:hypothetical protein